MPSENTSKTKNFSTIVAARIKQERERRAWTQAELAERVGSTRINVNRWENGVTLPSLYYRRRLAELFEQSLQELGFLPQNNEQNIGEEGLSDNLEHTSPLWNVPHRRNPYFTGRKKILQQLRTEFVHPQVSQTPIALSGLGGIGKTQIAMEYAYHYRDSYKAIFWLNAFTSDTLSTDIVTVVDLLGLARQQEQIEVVVQALKHWLMTHSHWLLILDNISSIESTNELLPPYISGHVLLTTRMQAVGTLAHSIPVEDMTQEEGVAFLLRRTKLLAPSETPTSHSEWSDASKIVTVLSGLPLALDQAGAYIEETRCGLAQYLRHYLSHQQELLQRRGMFPIHHPVPVTTTWQLSFQQIERNWPTSADVLYLCAFLDSDSIPEELLVPNTAQIGPTMDQTSIDTLELDNILEPLHLYSLIHRSPETGTLSMHRLVQTVIRQNLPRDVQKQWVERVIRILASTFPDPKKDNTTLIQCRRLFPQVMSCVQLFIEYELYLPEAESLFDRAGDYASQDGNYKQAKMLFQRTLTLREHIYSADDFPIARSLSRLGETHRLLGNYKDAEPLLLRALSIYKNSSLSQPMLEFADTLNTLGQLYHEIGRHDDAEQHFKHALETTQSVGGPNHIDTLMTLHYLARLYHSQQQIEKAQETFGHVLKAQERLLGTNHFQIAVILNNLAVLYRSQHNYEDAKTLLLRVLHMEEAVLGADHPRTATALHNLGVVYRKQKMYEQAEEMFLKALEVKEKARGPAQLSTIVTMTNLAHLYRKQKRYQESQALLQKALVADLGSGHPYAIVVFRNLARLYQEEENYEEAEKHYLQALSICKKIFPASYMEMKIVLASLAELYSEMQQEEKAVEFEQQLAALDKRLQ